jgi:hypothetical protein
LLGEVIATVVYGGSESYRRREGHAVAWSGIDSWIEESIGA